MEKIKKILTLCIFLFLFNLISNSNSFALDKYNINNYKVLGLGYGSSPIKLIPKEKVSKNNAFNGLKGAMQGSLDQAFKNKNSVKDKLFKNNLNSYIDLTFDEKKQVKKVWHPPKVEPSTKYKKRKVKVGDKINKHRDTDKLNIKED